MWSHPGRHVGLVGVGLRFLSDEPWIAEPDRCTEPPFALGTSAVEFWNFDESRLGGRWAALFGKDIVMGALDSFLSSTAGHFRIDEEEQFPWASSGQSIWYALLVVEEGKIVRYGFTASKGQKSNLREALRSLNGRDALLLGIWHGQYRTDLFVLDIAKAFAKLA